MFFLDVQTICDDRKFTHLFTENQFLAELFQHIFSFLRFGTVFTVAHRCFQIWSGWNKLHTELLLLKEIFLKKIAAMKILYK